MATTSSAMIRVVEACKQLGIDQSFLIHCIQTHWIEPKMQSTATEESLLDEEDLARIQLIHELQEDLGANDESIPIILHLLDQLYQIRRLINLFQTREQT